LLNDEGDKMVLEFRGSIVTGERKTGIHEKCSADEFIEKVNSVL
jgi:hypothetical protein